MRRGQGGGRSKEAREHESRVGHDDLMQEELNQAVE